MSRSATGSPGSTRSEPRVRARVEVAGRSHPGKVRAEQRGPLPRRPPLPGPRGARDEPAGRAPRRVGGSTPTCWPSPTAWAAATSASWPACWPCGPAGSWAASEIKWPVRVNEREAEELRQKAGSSSRSIDDALLAEVAREAPAGRDGHDPDDLLLDRPRAVRHARGRLAGLPLPRRRPPAADPRPHLAQVLVDAGRRRARLARGPADAPRPDQLSWAAPTPAVDVDVGHHRLADGDRLLLCTDGLTDLVTDDEIARVLADHPDPDDACRALVDLALERGGQRQHHGRRRPLLLRAPAGGGGVRRFNGSIYLRLSGTSNVYVSPRRRMCTSVPGAAYFAIAPNSSNDMTFVPRHQP